MLNINHETSNGSVQVESCNEKYDRFIFILKMLFIFIQHDMETYLFECDCIQCCKEHEVQ